MTEAFTALRVVEVAGSAAGGYAAKLFADLGAAVTRLARGPEDANAALRLYLDRDKRRARLDPESPDAQAGIAHWLQWADVWIESSAPDPLRRIAQDPLPPHLIAVAISPFGDDGPYRAWRSTELTDEAIGGQLALNGEPRREPLARPGLQAHYQAGLHAFIGAVCALRVRQRAHRGQRVEVAHLEGLASMHQHTTAMWTHGRHVLTREGNRQPGYWHPAGIYRCHDDYVALDLAIAEHRDRFLAIAELPELLVDERFADDLALGAHKDAFDAEIEPWLRAHDAQEIVSRLQCAGVPAGPVLSFREVLDDPHLAARDAWRDSAGTRLPATALRISVAETRRAAPVRAAPQASRSARSPLDGIRVLDLSRVWAGPYAARLLADLGADVVAVEAPNARGGRRIPPDLARRTHLFPEDEAGARPWNRLGSVNEIQRNKRGITLDLKRPEARRVFEQLLARCDVLLANFSPRVVPGLALSFEDLLRHNAGLIHCSITGYGAWGPGAARVALGPVIEAGSGLAHAMGYRDGGPCRSGVAWADPIAGLHAVAGILCALHEREADPFHRGRFVDISMQESLLAVCGEQIAALQRSAAPDGRRGNRHPDRAPQGVYPLGRDEWIAISVVHQRDWEALCTCLRLDSSLAGLDLAARHARHDEIDAALASRLRGEESERAVARLQTAGVCAAPVADARALCEDVQLASRGFWATCPHPEAGLHRMPGCPVRLSSTPARYRRAAPRLGEHNFEVLQEWAGFTQDALAALEAAGILVQTPP